MGNNPIPPARAYSNVLQEPTLAQRIATLESWHDVVEGGLRAGLDYAEAVRKADAPPDLPTPQQTNDFQVFTDGTGTLVAFIDGVQATQFPRPKMDTQLY